MSDESHLQKTRRVSDMLCSAHAELRDRYKAKAMMLDISILAATIWLTAMVFVEPKIGGKLTPFSFDKDIWLGILAIFASFLSVVQIKVGWKGLADAHGRAVNLFSSVKTNCSILIEHGSNATEHEIRRVLDQYEYACAASVVIPESKFTALKQHHLLKVEVSRHLDSNPSVSLPLLKIRWWFRDNFGKKKKILLEGNCDGEQ